MSDKGIEDLLNQFDIDLDNIAKEHRKLILSNDRVVDAMKKMEEHRQVIGKLYNELRTKHPDTFYNKEINDLIIEMNRTYNYMTMTNSLILMELRKRK